MKRFIVAADSLHKVQLEVHYQAYDWDWRNKIIRVTGSNLLAALGKMGDHMNIGFDTEVIEFDEMTEKDCLEHIHDCNGDGGDYIYFFKNLTTGEIYIDESPEVEEYN